MYWYDSKPEGERRFGIKRYLKAIKRYRRGECTWEAGLSENETPYMEESDRKTVTICSGARKYEIDYIHDAADIWKIVLKDG